LGEYLSALSNSAALHRKESGYLVWGIADGPGNPVVGTTFRPHSSKVGNENLEGWLTRLLSPRANFQIYETTVDQKVVVIICVQPAPGQPVRFSGTDYIRIGSYKKPLKDHAEKERALWATLSTVPFERGIAMTGATSEQVLRLIDYPSMFRLLNQGLPENRAGIIAKMVQEKIVLQKASDRFDVTNLGAILFATNLAHFDRLSRKSLRVIIYKGVNRVETLREQQGGKGYATGFEGAIRFINEQLPQNEQIGEALRKEVRMYPELAIRELVANALIHQDFNLTGTGPMVEIFSDRMEITNPGTPLIDTLRFIDEPPQSRNEALAGIMRRVNICEERGSGIDKVIFNVEIFQLPAPEFKTTQEHTKVTLFSHRKLTQMDKDHRIRACYQHACLLHVSGRRMTNATLRKRFGIADQNYAIASRIIGETVDGKLVRPFDPVSKSKKHISYVPFWA
jgi:predicted HTH transcriptional regulator